MYVYFTVGLLTETTLSTVVYDIGFDLDSKLVINFHIPHSECFILINGSCGNPSADYEQT